MTQPTTVLVTGASGFIATHCIIQLLKRGYAVRGSLRTPARGDSIRAIIGEHTDPGNRLDFVAADLTDDTGWAAAAEGCQYVVHTASPIPLAPPKHADDLIVPARDGALRVLKAASQAGVKRTVMTSSTAAVCYGHKGAITRPFTEEDWSTPEGGDHSAYTRSKTIAERAAWDLMAGDKSGMTLAVVNPGAVLGPVLEKDYGSSAEIVRKLMAGEFPGYAHLGWPLVDVRDVADMHVLAMETPAAAGERFLCAGEFLWMKEITEVLRSRYADYARKLPRRNLPNWVVRLFALFDPATASVVSALDRKHEVSHDKATRVLGWTPRPAAEAIAATADSLIKFGIV
jgi:dihydroflavonol-4-reductase